MDHRHLNHDEFTLAAIDSLIERGTVEDWLRLAREIRGSHTVRDRVRQLCAARLSRPDPEFYTIEDYRYWCGFGDDPEDDEAVRAAHRRCHGGGPTAVLLFLDIDGVLHPLFPRADRTEAENLYFSYLPRVEAVLREFPQVQIVVASDWRKRHSLEELRGFFSDNLRERIVGVIGIDDADHELGNRQRLVERYLIEQGLTESTWLALDDDAGNYLAGASLVLCDDGFQEQEERALRAALSGKPIPGARAMAAAVAFMGDRDRATAWYRAQGIAEFDGKTAEELVLEGREADVLKYIDMLSVGSTG